MTVGKLKRMLEKYPDEMKILNGRCSDWQIIEESEWSIIKGVDKGYWIMESHESMSDENKSKEEEFLALDGN